MDMIAKLNQDNRLSRKNATAEDFTPTELVNHVIDRLLEYSPDAFTNPEKTFIDPAVGNGNILIEVLKRKLEHTDPLQALSTIYGCDILKDNIDECRLRLLKVVVVHGNVTEKEDFLKAMRLLWKNIVRTPLCDYPNGSLDYLAQRKGMAFVRRGSNLEREEIYDNIMSQELLEQVKI